jgi:thioredoxin reductase (NADPH)
VPGVELLSRLREQAERYGVDVTRAEATGLHRTEGGFEVVAGAQRFIAPKVLLATGVEDVQPGIENLRTAIRQGHVRLCPVCDGYEVIGKDVAVLGPADKAVAKALFLRPYTDRITVLLTSGSQLDEAQRQTLAEAGVRWFEPPVVDLAFEDAEIGAVLANGERRSIDVLYPALGSRVRAGLALELGAECAAEGYLKADVHQRTTVPGLYAAGDVVNELNQICVATGHAAIAATDIYNSLRGKSD